MLTGGRYAGGAFVSQCMNQKTPCGAYGDSMLKRGKKRRILPGDSAHVRFRTQSVVQHLLITFILLLMMMIIIIIIINVSTAAVVKVRGARGGPQPPAPI